VESGSNKEEEVNALVEGESGSSKEEEVSVLVEVESDNNMEVEVSALVVEERGSSKALVVVVEMSRCSCQPKFEMGG